MEQNSKAFPEDRILKAANDLRKKLDRPVVVAIDGGSGAGKTTLATKLTARANIALITLDDFYQTRIPESDWPHRTVEERLNGVFDWERVRRMALEPLRSGKPGEWQAFDFVKGLNDLGTYDLKDETTKVDPAPIILIEGAYSASPRLRDLIDLAVLVSVPSRIRHDRIEHRERDSEDFLDDWHAVWDEVESLYFARVCPPASFDILVPNWR